MQIILPYGGEDIELKNILIRLQNFLNGGISFDNFTCKVITGTTSPTANTMMKIRHGLEQKPCIVLPIKGNIYIYNYLDTEIDVRSTQSAVQFSALVIGGQIRRG